MDTKYKMLALDMDGTLLTSNQTISPDTSKWIQRAKDEGVHVCLSTGRGFESALPYGEELGLSTPMITVNGSEVWRAPHELHQRSLMDPQLISDMRAIALAEDCWYWAYSVDKVYNKDVWTDSIEEKEWLKFGFHTEDDEARHRILMQLQEMGGLEITNSSPHNLEINPQGINKASGIRTVCGLLGLEMNEVIAVGDSMNDLAAIQAAGVGVAMGNAQEVVREAADYVTSSNDRDGIAEVIRKFIFQM
ncbi:MULTISPECIES: Cof-type HAD-IIB family hydrolase [Paenibacillus]|uniref:5-amino-6-(5-phospho-D-ribitylamino)uracil phosphatase YcsE n=1 Tax=Paenibacillus albilobatus TaxID=2716884 RepID=A0A919XJH6_9BACL|nr:MULTISPECIES: Cof-type HAD-IIB family hydrolase [Paenibacillus]MDR9856759.1 Cof-type HAD-IIB family hydrolase [Paenibacillus sp. VCA1]GIO33859.1 5-amino-6-(5-phospho-D-ribitylamino)uracil phosphatase YcsE [Paenibacillus albilobatus]